MMIYNMHQLNPFTLFGYISLIGTDPIVIGQMDYQVKFLQVRLNDANKATLTLYSGDMASNAAIAIMTHVILLSLSAAALMEI